MPEIPWTPIDDWATIEAAQRRLGLSDERTARLIPVAVRTFARWKERGAIPSASIEALARVLGLSLYPTLDSTQPIAGAQAPVSLDDLAGRLESLEAKVDRLATGDDFQHGLDVVREAIDALATRGTRKGRTGTDG